MSKQRVGRSRRISSKAYAEGLHDGYIEVDKVKKELDAKLELLLRFKAFMLEEGISELEIAEVIDGCDPHKPGNAKKNCDTCSLWDIVPCPHYGPCGRHLLCWKPKDAPEPSDDKRIRRVSVLGNALREQAEVEGLKDSDLVLVTTTIHEGRPPTYELEKVEGSPTEWLLNRCKPEPSDDKVHGSNRQCDNSKCEACHSRPTLREMVGGKYPWEEEEEKAAARKDEIVVEWTTVFISEGGDKVYKYEAESKLASQKFGIDALEQKVKDKSECIDEMNQTRLDLIKQLETFVQKVEALEAGLKKKR